MSLLAHLRGRAASARALSSLAGPLSRSAEFLRARAGFVRALGSPAGPLTCSEEVLQARSERRPLVALESTIITHGMPYPDNLRTATQVEQIIREKGAVPATVAVLAGRVTVGLSAQQLAALARSEGAVKASRRDLAYVAAEGLDGATTVAGTIVAAQLAAIPVFATGGIGGVHRAGQHTLDVSADLTELGRNSTCVVCSGVKSILDIPRTLEYLETQGVCVAAFGSSRAFPAFYTRSSGHDAPYRLADAAQCARVLHASHALRLRSGLLVAVPVPRDSAMEESEIEAAIEAALAEAERRGVRGKDITPFLLAAVADATKGRSLAANIALIKNNAAVAADIAIEFAKLSGAGDSSGGAPPAAGSPRGAPLPAGSPRGAPLPAGSPRGAPLPAGCPGGAPLPAGSRPRAPLAGPLVIGGANLDSTYRLVEHDLKVNKTRSSDANKMNGKLLTQIEL